MARMRETEKTVLMLETKPGCRNGLSSELFEKGNIYTLPIGLATNFLEAKWAKVPTEEDLKKDEAPVQEKKMDTPAPQNKMVTASTDNKAAKK